MTSTNHNLIFSLSFARNPGYTLTMYFTDLTASGDRAAPYSYTFADDNAVTFATIWMAATGLTLATVPKGFSNVRFMTSEAFRYTRNVTPSTGITANAFSSTNSCLCPAVSAGLLTELP